MSSVLSSMRLVHDGGNACRTASPSDLLEQVAAYQSEIDSLREEIASLQRRDESLRFYMHRLDEELRLAARLQQDFLPKLMPEVGPVRFHTLFRPAGYVSGDLYDVMRLDERHVGFFICDAVGHGMPAALLTMFIKRALVTKEIFPQGGYRLLDPSETLTRLNLALAEQNLSQATYATALYGIIDTHTLEISVAQGGHPAPAVLAPDGTLDFVSASGALLGIFPEETFESRRFTLSPRQRLLIYSDGVEVAFCEDGAIDTLRWREHVRQRAALPSAPFLQSLAEEIDRQTGSLQPKDDLTLIVMEVSG